MTGIGLIAILALVVVAAYIYMLGRGERGEAYSPMWPVKGTRVPGSEPAEEGALIPGGEPERATMETREAA